MAAPSIADVPANVTVGVDTHKHSHIARAKDGLGRHLGQLKIDTDPRGYADLLAWAQGFGPVVTFGIEGTSSYGAGLTRFLRAEGQAVIEVLRPVRRDRRFGAKSDPVRALKIAKQTAIKARTQAVNAVKGLIVIAPDPIREQLRNLKTPALVRTCSAYRVDGASDPTSAIKLSLRSMCRRYIVLDQEVCSLEKELDTLTLRLVPQLRQLFGVGQDVAASLVLAAGNSGDRLRSEASFSMLCGASPIPASSGVVRRHRLNRGGDRQANAALHQIVVVRLRYDEATRTYFAKRKADGKSKKEIFRCLKRYVAREVYRTLVDPREEAACSAA